MPHEGFKKFAVLLLMGMRRCDKIQRRHLKKFVREYSRTLDFNYPNGMTEGEATAAIKAESPKEAAEIASVAPRLIIPTGINPESLK